MWIFVRGVVLTIPTLKLLHITQGHLDLNAEELICYIFHGVLLETHIGLTRSSVVYTFPVFCLGEFAIPFFFFSFIVLQIRVAMGRELSTFFQQKLEKWICFNISVSGSKSEMLH